MKRLVFLLLFCLGSHTLMSQNVGIGTNSPDPTSILEIMSTDRGLLIPRLTTAQRNAISNPANGLMIYNITTNCLEIYNAVTSTWKGLCPCDPPSNFTANPGTPGCTSFTANWIASTGANNYLLTVATDASFSNVLPGYDNLNVGNVTTYNVTGLNMGTTYYYKLKAVSICGESNETNSIAITTNNDLSSVLPIANSATFVTNTSFVANWNPVSGANHYLLTVATTPSFIPTSILPAYNNLNVGNVNSYSVTGLTQATTYYYRIVAVNSCGNSLNSNTICQTTTGGKVFFNYAGNNYQTWVVPCGVTQISIKAWGAGGGSAGNASNTCITGNGGGGSYSSSTVTVNGGDILHIYVGQGGGGGTYSNAGSNVYIPGGYGGWGYGSGGKGGDYWPNCKTTWSNASGGGGGGSSAVFNSSTNTLYVCAGGGGGGGADGTPVLNCVSGGSGGAGNQNGQYSSFPNNGIASAASSPNGTNGLDCNNSTTFAAANGGGGGGALNGGLGGQGVTFSYSVGGGGGNSLGSIIMHGSWTTPGNFGDPDLCNGCAAGGAQNPLQGSPGNSGGNGRVVISW